ncbi:MAG: hypothetical protein ACLTEE_00950 [Anaerobutyricum hallii]
MTKRIGNIYSEHYKNLPMKKIRVDDERNAMEEHAHLSIESERSKGD